MSETPLTKEIKKALAKKLSDGSATRFATEVECRSGVVDFMTCRLPVQGHDDAFFGYHMMPIITCYEIKISISDFKSLHGHNMVGDKNYYVITDKIWEWLNKENNVNPYLGNGFIIYKNGRFYMKVESLLNRKPLSLENRFYFIDQIMKRLQLHSAYHLSLIKED